MEMPPRGVRGHLGGMEMSHEQLHYIDYTLNVKSVATDLPDLLTVQAKDLIGRPRWISLRPIMRTQIVEQL